MMRKTSLAICTALIACAAVGTAQAAPISCPGTPSTTDREFILTVTSATGTASCFDFGPGNLEGPDDEITDQGYVFLDKENEGGNPEEGWLDITGINSTSGTFTISGDAWDAYSSLIIAFKSGAGQLDPDWAAFLLTPEVLSGTWSITGSQSLSHANLYGANPNSPPPPPPVVPEPASMLLLGTGLLAMARSRRLRRH
jgi:hypothetical protein